MSVSPLRTSPSDTRPEINFGELLHTLDKNFGTRVPELIGRFAFDYDGMTFDTRRITQNTGNRFLLTASIGRLPFSIESIERRNAIKTIVQASRKLPKVQFSIDNSGKITAGAVYDSAPLAAPDFIFYPLILFLQEARPFMKLIGRYLEAEHSISSTPPTTPSNE